MSFLCYFVAKHDVSKITHFRGSVFLKFSVCAIFYALFILYPFARWFCSRQLSTTVGGSRARTGRRRRQSTTTERWEWSSWRRSPRRGTRAKQPLRSQDQLGGHLRRVGTVWDVSQLGAWALNQFVSIGLTIARIANAVQITLWLSVNHLNRCLCSHCSHWSQCLLVSTRVY